MTSAVSARVLNLRFRLGLVDLPAVERWADQAILQDEGRHPELVDLCLASKKGAKLTQAQLALLGDGFDAGDLMRALGAVKVEAQTGDELRLLADNLDPLLKELQTAGKLPEMLKPALTLATDFWHARIQSDDSFERVESEMRELLHTVQRARRRTSRRTRARREGPRAERRLRYRRQLSHGRRAVRLPRGAGGRQPGRSGRPRRQRQPGSHAVADR